MGKLTADGCLWEFPKVFHHPLPVRVKWITACFHPYLLSLIQKAITSDFPLQERDREIEKKWWETDREARKSTKTILLGISFIWWCQRGKTIHFCSLAPCPLHPDDEIGWWNIFQQNVVSTKINLSVIGHGIVIGSLLKLHMLSHNQLVPGSCCFSYTSHQWQADFTAKDAHTHHIPSQQQQLCFCDSVSAESAKNVGTLYMTAWLDRYLTFLSHARPSSSPTLWSTVGNSNLAALHFSFSHPHPSFSGSLHSWKWGQLFCLDTTENL